MFEHLYGYGQLEQQQQQQQQQQQSRTQPQQQQANQSKQLHSYGDGSYDYGNSLNDVPSTSSLPAFAFLSQHTGLASELHHLQEPQQFNGFSHDTTTNPNNNNNNNSMNRRSSSIDEQTSTLNQFSAFETLEHSDITDPTFSMPQLYHPVDISTIVHSPILGVPDLPLTLPPLHSSTVPQPPPLPSSLSSSTSVLQSDNLPASKKQRLARGFRERAPWTPEEDHLLRLAVQLYGDKTEKWSKIAECVQGRTNKNCRKRWFHSLDPSLRKGAWTDEEDQLLREGVKKFPNQWSKIADMLEGRTDDQCAKRWRESLDPTIDRSDWTDEEDARLASKFEELGSQWQKIAQSFDGRPGLHCRNRWRKLLRIAQVKKQKERTSLYISSATSATTTATTTTTTTTIANLGIIEQGEHFSSDTTNGKQKGNGTNSGHTKTTEFINMGPDQHSNAKNISAPSTSSISALIYSTSSPLSSPSLSSPCSTSSSSSSSSPSSSPLTPSAPPASSSSTLSTGNIASSKSNSSLPSFLQPQTFHTTCRPQNISSTNTTPIQTTFDAMNDRRQQDYETPEPLGHLKPYGCDVFGCLESFSQSSELFYHMKNAHPDLKNVTKPYRCAVAFCTKKYKNINGLQYHLRDARGISSHILASASSSPLKTNNNNNANHGEIIIPTTGNSQNNNNGGDGNNEKSMNDSSTRMNSEMTAPSAQQLHTLSLDNIGNSNEMTHDRPFSCPMIGCKDSFDAIDDLKLHQDQHHNNPFQLAAITALTNPLVDSCLLQPLAHSLTTPAIPIPSSVATPSSTPLQQEEQQNQNQFRVRREKWLMESV